MSEDKLPEKQPQPVLVGGMLGIIGATCVILTCMFLAYLYVEGAPPFSATERSRVSSGAGETEVAFQKGIVDEGVKDDAVLAEWRSVRSDHKAIAYTIAECVGLDPGRLPRSAFGRLLLDLQPNGDHYWPGASGAITAATQEPGLQRWSLPSYPESALLLSDAIGRARLEAAAGAAGNWPKMSVFNWFAVLVSAFATLAVTLRTTYTDKGRWTLLLTLAAISLSTIGTVLTSAKTFYDPTRAYLRNERALLELQKLHQDVTLTFVQTWDSGKCDAREGERDKQSRAVAMWVSELKDQHDGLIQASVGDVPLPTPRPADHERVPDDSKDGLIRNAVVAPVQDQSGNPLQPQSHGPQTVAPIQQAARGRLQGTGLH